MIVGNNFMYNVYMYNGCFEIVEKIESFGYGYSDILYC